MIWLTGNKGMLGREVEKRLASLGLPFISSDREVDISDARAVADLASGYELSWIINCAAYTAVERAEDEEQLAMRVNANGPANLAALAGKIGARIIHISTDYVFDGIKDGEYTETDVVNPLGAYARTKVEGEKNIIAATQMYFIIRTAWLYGQNGSNFVRTMLDLFNSRDEVKVVSDQWGNPTFAGDLADAIIRIVRSGNDEYGIYNFTNAGRTSWHEFAREIYLLGKKYGLVRRDVNIVPISSAECPSKVKRPKNTALSKEKFQRVFGMRPRNWKEALGEFLIKGFKTV